MPTDHFTSTGGWPARIQAGCAAVGLLFAIYAYNSWKHQEQAKRAAQIAEEILANVLSAINCLQSDIPFLIKLVPSDQDIDRVVVRSRAIITKCSPDFDKLAKGVGHAQRPGPKAGKAIADFSKLLSDRESSTNFLDNYKVLRGEESTKQRVEGFIRRHLARLAWVNPNHMAPDKAHKPEQVEELKKEWMALEDANAILDKHSLAIGSSLMPIIRFEN